MKFKSISCMKSSELQGNEEVSILVERGNKQKHTTEVFKLNGKGNSVSMDSEPIFERVSGFYMDSKKQFQEKLIDFTLLIDGKKEQKLSFNMVSEFGFANNPVVQDFDNKGVQLTVQFAVIDESEKEDALKDGFKDNHRVSNNGQPSGGCCTIF